MSESDKRIQLSKVVVPKTARGTGVGSDFMKDLTKYADNKALRVDLTPSTSFGGTSLARLTSFYKKFGFVSNSGKNKDYEISDTMYRLPDAKRNNPYREPNGRFGSGPDNSGGGSGAEVVSNEPVQPVSLKNDYEGFHNAPTRENDAPLHDLTGNGIYPADVYSKKGEQIYGTGHRKGLDAEAHKLILSMQGKPDAIVEVYRSVPSNVEAVINPGDWVTPFKDYAIEHGESNLNNDYKIASLDVKASDIFTEGNSWLEWGYDPAPTRSISLRLAMAMIARNNPYREPNGQFGNGPGGPKAGSGFNHKQVYDLQASQSDTQVDKVYAAEEKFKPQNADRVEPPFPPTKELLETKGREAYDKAYKEYNKKWNDWAKNNSKSIHSELGKKHLNGTVKGSQAYVDDVVKSDWFLEKFGDGGPIGQPKVALKTSNKFAGRYYVSTKDGGISGLDVQKTMVLHEPTLIHEISHYATTISTTTPFSGHGEIFTKNHIFVAENIAGAEYAAGLRKAYEDGGVKIG